MIPDTIAKSDLTLEHGFATFIVANDDAAVLSRFAHETAPEVGERVTAERARRTGISNASTESRPAPEQPTDERGEER